jgi:hypothetical protein
MNRIHLLIVLLTLIVLLAAIAVPFAAAETIQLNQNNLGISGSIGTLSLLGTGILGLAGVMRRRFKA